MENEATLHDYLNGALPSEALEPLDKALSASSALADELADLSRIEVLLTRPLWRKPEFGGSHRTPFRSRTNESGANGADCGGGGDRPLRSRVGSGLLAPVETASDRTSDIHGQFELSRQGARPW